MLIVIVVLAILASIVIMASQNMEGSSGAAACKADYKLAESAQESYRVQMGTSATSFPQLTTATPGPGGNTLGPWLKEAPSTDHGYVISFDLTPGSTFGNIMVASTSPAHAAQDGSANCTYA